MSTRLQIDGIDEMRQILRQLPSELTHEASMYVTRRAAEAVNQIRANYGAHRKTGHMQDSVSVTTLGVGRFGAGALVLSKDAGANAVENGRQVNPFPPFHAFIPPMMRARRALDGDLAAMLRRAGFEVINV